MLTLGIDTSTDNLGLALIENDIIKAEYNLTYKKSSIHAPVWHLEVVIYILIQLLQP